MASAVEKLMRRVATLQNLVLRTKNRTIAWDKDTVTLTDIKMVHTDLGGHNVKLVSLFENVSDIATPDEMTTHEPTFDTIFSAVNKMQIEVGELLTLKESALKAKTSPAFKLERIKLPQFNGNVSEWQSFHDLFISSVDQNPTLTGSEKMIHLKSSLVGDASTIVSSFAATDANYKQAWDLVVKRYSNKREIIFAHIRKFDELKCNQVESASGLRTITDTINETVRSLTNLGVPVDQWDLILIYLTLEKLSAETRKQWLLDEKAALPKLDKFIEYLEARARALADSDHSTKSKTTGNKRSSSHAVSSSSNLACPQCAEPHHLYKCKLFVGSSVAERKELVSKKQLCFNCLFPNHSRSKCRMDFTCRKCGQRHHTLLHSDSVTPPKPSVAPVAQSKITSPKVEDSTSASHCTPYGNGNNIVLLGTLLVTILDSSGVDQKCRVFVDPGSESNFISEFCVDRLGLKRKRTCVNVSGIGGSSGGTATGILNININSLINDFSLPIHALILKKLTNQLPRAKCNSDWPHLKGLELADPSFNIPGHIDILLGAADAPLIMLPGIKYGSSGIPSAQKTKFGWMLSGEVSQSYQIQVQSHHMQCQVNETCLESTLTKFWELEEPEVQERSLSEEDAACEEHFLKTHIRNPEGGYTVELPFQDSTAILGQSRASAFQRFSRVEKRLSNHPLIKEEYVRCMRESIASNFMELVPPEEVYKSYNHSYYMPHREVVKESSSTTKVRIVYDASAKSTNGLSLNDILMTGPKLQVDLVPLLIRFRSHRVAMSADIVKFYPQFKVNQKHTDYQRLLWREDPSLPIQDYRMLRVTFGVKSAPYLAIRCLQQLAEDEQQQFPKAVSVIKEDFLVDNLLSGADDEKSALSLQKEILNVMQRGKLDLRKWSSNNINVVNSVPPEQREVEFPLSIKEDEALKTIGLLWNPAADTFGVSINMPDVSLPITKRKVLSSIAKTFDPLGWLSPVTVNPKVMMQLLWKEKLDWDTTLPTEFTKMWIQYCEDLTLLKAFRINRCLVGRYR